MMEKRIWDKKWPKGVRQHLEYPNISLHKFFEQKVRENAKHAYLSIKGIDFSFESINEQASRFATALIGKGIQKGDKVGVFMPNLPQFVIAFFGILKTGATVVPISPLYGESDLQKCINDSGIKAIIALDIVYANLGKVLPHTPNLKHVIVTSIGDILPPVLRFIAKLLKKLPPSPEIPNGIKFYDLIKNHEPLINSADVNPEEDIAVIGYTGGTTGTPKGAMLTHKNLVSNLIMAREWAMAVQPLGVHKKFVGAVPFFHIIGLTAVMLVGFVFDSTVYLFPDPRQFESILQAISKQKINYFHGVPTLFKAILDHPSLPKYDLSSLDIVFSGAAPLPITVKEEFEKHINGIMVEAYGMTETSPIVAANPFERDNRKTGSIGIPFVDTDLKIINMDSGAECAVGEPGEIIIKGPQVMKGYLNNPKETAEVLKDGYMHTGDIASFDSDGFIKIVGRKKEMIIASGYKIFPSELEEIVYRDLPDIAEVAIIGVPDEYRGESVKMIAVLRDKAKITADEIINFFKEKVAKYKVPSKVEFRTSLPKTMVGKIDRKLLLQESSASVK